MSQSQAIVVPLDRQGDAFRTTTAAYRFDEDRQRSGEKRDGDTVINNLKKLAEKTSVLEGPHSDDQFSRSDISLTSRPHQVTKAPGGIHQGTRIEEDSPNGTLDGLYESVGPRKTTTNGNDTLSTPNQQHTESTGSTSLNGTDPRQSLGSSQTHTMGDEVRDRVLKLSPEKMFELASSHMILPCRTPSSHGGQSTPSRVPQSARRFEAWSNNEETPCRDVQSRGWDSDSERLRQRKRSGSAVNSPSVVADATVRSPITEKQSYSPAVDRPSIASRTFSTPFMKLNKFDRPISECRSSVSKPKLTKPTPTPLKLESPSRHSPAPQSEGLMPSPMPTSIPMPPLSIPAYLQLELSSNKPSPLYIYRSSTNALPYESSQVKIERLLNFILLPPQLEPVLWFGALACLDAWLYNFTILPLRFFKALYLLFRSWSWRVRNEIDFLASYTYSGIRRLWRRTKPKAETVNLKESTMGADRTPSAQEPILDGKSAKLESPHHPKSGGGTIAPQSSGKYFHNNGRRHRRMKQPPPTLMLGHKGDLLRGLLIIISCTILMYFDASMMYHSIRGQAAIKLYVIYNVLEVCDRLLSAFGQDVLECLFSKETLEPKSTGPGLVVRPLWLFLLALLYCLAHSTALFYQVITLNVAVNSYSNALFTLLLSNQFVEVRSTVFRKFEKENLFQMTCADVVERFQLWLMLVIIASRNIIETNSLIGGGGSSADYGSPGSGAPSRSSGVLPKSFTLFPEWTGQVMGPFLLVLGTEMIVDWIKHAYITKFNNTKPTVYGRFLDVLAKDYYSNAFSEQNLTRRIGLPVIPLSCLFIRASVQTYQMFLATYIPLPVPSPATSLSLTPASSTPTNPIPPTSLHHHLTTLFRRALGRTTFPHPQSPNSTSTSSSSSSSFFSFPLPPNQWTPTLPLSTPSPDTITLLTTTLLFLLLFILLLICKLLLGMALLSYSRRRYRGMKSREGQRAQTAGKRSGWAGGVVEIGDDRRRWLFADDEVGLRALREKEREEREKGEKGEGQGARGGEQQVGSGLEGVERYAMVGKKIW